MPLPTKRDHVELRDRLRSWLTGQVQGDGGVEISELKVPEGTGMSSETLLFTATWPSADGPVTRELVARMSPDMEDYPVFPAYDLDLQARCMRLVGERTAVPVPEVLWLEPTSEPLGAPFLVMGRIEGAAPRTSRSPTCSPAPSSTRIRPAGRPPSAGRWRCWLGSTSCTATTPR